MYLSLILFVLIGILVVLGKLTFLANRFFKYTVAKMSEFDGEVDESVSSYDEMRMNRESEYDKRINQMMDELGMKEEGTNAEILNPNVYNIPHNSITIDKEEQEIAD